MEIEEMYHLQWDHAVVIDSWGKETERIKSWTKKTAMGFKNVKKYLVQG